ncbi:MAG: LTA synthase family protein [Prevotella sp.]
MVRYNNVSLSEREIIEIDNYIKAMNQERTPMVDSCQVKGTPNIILILVESYISEASKVRIGGKSVTPNLNKLIGENGTYCNMKMQSQRGAGESSDAQVSYFTGLIPLSSELSISYIAHDSIIGLPRLLKEQKQYTTYITLPTPSYFWHQNELNPKYGIDNVIDCIDKGNNWCDDEMLFNKLEWQNLRQPFFNTILTVSMHGSYEGDMPYNTKADSPFTYPKNYSKEFCHYLDRCYFTDMQIGKYINHLKKTRLYENSVIIITSDHQTKPNSLNMDVNDKDLPLIIVNSGIDLKRFWKGEMNQIDLYPTLLDMFGIECEWRGFGRSILRSGYSSKISARSKEISGKIIRGNYFGQ